MLIHKSPASKIKESAAKGEQPATSNQQPATGTISCQNSLSVSHLISCRQSQICLAPCTESKSSRLNEQEDNLVRTTDFTRHNNSDAIYTQIECSIYNPVDTVILAGRLVEITAYKTRLTQDTGWTTGGDYRLQDKTNTGYWLDDWILAGRLVEITAYKTRLTQDTGWTTGGDYCLQDKTDTGYWLDDWILAGRLVEITAYKTRLTQDTGWATGGDYCLQDKTDTGYWLDDWWRLLPTRQY
ncbi:hypothetical protein RRG08_052669 [Elysia crispata]|uniref:Uncharacterized protein n=1 Tax=Elysia crispata TaxID=231223 RepID=A0AAE1AQH4_9GAST|nr:hypothetical protein RRG08_052669 [Elysia crispata]